MKARWSLASRISLATLTLSLGAHVAWAASTCIQAANAEYGDCKASCLHDFELLNAACINKDATCVLACDAKRQDCVKASGLPAALKACNVKTLQAIQRCNRNIYCIEEAQAVAFQCRKDAHTQAKPALTQCDALFNKCTGACPPGGGSVGNPAVCMQQAQQKDLNCVATCTTDFRSESSACHPTTSGPGPKPGPAPPSPVGTCAPPNCDDRGLCEPGVCVNGACEYTPLTGLDAVSCRLDQITELLASAPLTAIHGPALARRLLAKLRQLSGLVQAGRAGGRRGRRALRRADHGLAALIGAITSAANRGRLDFGLTASVMRLATGAKAALDPLLAQR